MFGNRVIVIFGNKLKTKIVSIIFEFFYILLGKFVVLIR
nr:MAG TPA: hypothetical protein [Caudoviricetes sp.]DAU58231.1 MAG TPA: hypothetical protein [Caudoviricetes sp.]